MYLSKILIKVSAFIPILVVFGIISLLIVSFLRFGYLPEYGVDKDPYSVFSISFMNVKNWSFIISFYLLILSFLTLITLLIIRIGKVTKRDKVIAIGIYVIGMLALVLLRESSAFQWLVD